MVLVSIFSPDGKKIASHSTDETLRLWDANTGKEIRQITGHQSNGTSNVVFSPDGKTLAGVQNDFAIRLYDPENGNELKKFEGHTKPWSRSSSRRTASNSPRRAMTARFASGTSPRARRRSARGPQ
jgi:WD40 repeat protein